MLHIPIPPFEVLEGGLHYLHKYITYSCNFAIRMFILGV